MSILLCPKERPVLFSGPMVRAILEGQKTQTRRVIKPQPKSQLAQLNEWNNRASNWIINQTAKGRFVFNPDPDGPLTGTALGEPLLVSIACPYGRIRDRLWVRETWADADRMYQSHTNEVPGVVAYYADKSAIQFDAKIPRSIPDYDLKSWNWDKLKCKPSIFMPRWASRITLEITDIRVERLKQISKADVAAEGVDQVDKYTTLAHSFAIGWNKLNGKRKGCDWDSNPWVWVIEFKRLNQ